MKKLFLAILITMSSLSYAVTTQEYKASFDSRYSDSRGKDSACSYDLIDGNDLPVPVNETTIIRIEAVGTGRWIDLAIPSALLPLAEGDDYVIKSVTGNMRLTYNDGILSYQVNDLSDENITFYKQEVAEIKVSGDLKEVDMLDAQEVSYDRTMFGRLKSKDLMRLQCKF